MQYISLCLYCINLQLCTSYVLGNTHQEACCKQQVKGSASCFCTGILAKLELDIVPIQSVFIHINLFRCVQIYLDGQCVVMDIWYLYGYFLVLYLYGQCVVMDIWYYMSTAGYQERGQCPKQYFQGFCSYIVVVGENTVSSKIPEKRVFSSLLEKRVSRVFSWPYVALNGLRFRAHSVGVQLLINSLQLIIDSLQFIAAGKVAHRQCILVLRTKILCCGQYTAAGLIPLHCNAIISWQHNQSGVGWLVGWLVYLNTPQLQLYQIHHILVPLYMRSLYCTYTAIFWSVLIKAQQIVNYSWTHASMLYSTMRHIIAALSQSLYNPKYFKKLLYHCSSERNLVLNCNFAVYIQCQTGILRYINLCPTVVLVYRLVSNCNLVHWANTFNQLRVAFNDDDSCSTLIILLFSVNPQQFFVKLLKVLDQHHNLSACQQPNHCIVQQGFISQ